MTATAASVRTGMSKALLLCIVGNLVLRVASNATGVMLALYLRFIDRTVEPVSATMVGLFGATFYLSELVLAPVFGGLSDRHGRKLYMLLGSGFGLVAVIMTGLTSLIPILLITRMLEGLSTAASAPAVLGLISSETDENEGLRGKAIAFFEIATVMGIAGGVAFGGFLWDRVHTTAFFIVAGIYLTSMLIFALIRPAARSAVVHAASWKRHVEVLTNPRVLHFAPAWLSINAIVGVWFAHGAFQLAGSRAPSGVRQFLAGGFSGTSTGAIFGAFGLTFMVGCFIWGLMFTRISRRNMLLVSLGGVFLTVLDLFLINRFGHLGGAPLIILVSLLVVFILIESGFTPASLGFLAEIAEEYPEDRGTIMGFYSIFLGGGQLIGSALGGPFADAFAVDGLILLTFLLSLVALATVLAMGSGSKSRAH